MIFAFARAGILVHPYIVRSLFAFIVVPCIACSSSTPTQTGAVCANDPRVETFQTGVMSKGATGASIAIVAATPSVVQEGLNEWTVSIQTSTGTPVDGGAVTITPFMPDHGHGSPTPATITPLGGGNYDIAGINLSMRGVWTITIAIASPTLDDSAAFTFCVDGTTS